MDRNQAKALMPIIQAYAEGKTIQYYDYLIDIVDWEDCENPNFENLNYKFRIKPESTYRPFANAEECWNEMQKHQPFGWVKTDSVYEPILHVNECDDFNATFKYSTFADGTPFGVKVEQYDILFL